MKVQKPVRLPASGHRSVNVPTSGVVPPHSKAGRPGGPSLPQGNEATARAGSQSGRGTSSSLRQPSPVASRHPLPSDGRGTSPQSGEGIPAGEQYLDPKGVGKRLKLSPRTVADMANEGRLPAYRVGIYLRFKWAKVEEFMEAECRVGAAKAESGNMRPEISLPRPDGPAVRPYLNKAASDKDFLTTK
jgi:excisionase family DNA binding protein